MHIAKTSEGRWRVIVQHNGQRRSSVRDTRGEAEHAGAQLVIELGGLPRPTDLTVGAVVAGYIAEKTLTWSPNTLADRTAAVKLIPPAFLQRSTSSITVPVVIALWKQMAAAGVTAHRVHRAGSVLGGAFAAAIKSGTIAGPNPFHLSPAPKPPAPDLTIPSTTDVRALIMAAADSLFALYVRVAATTGARRGELGAMHWDDVDLERGTWRIHRRVIKMTGEPVAILESTKTGTKGHRTVTLDPRTIELLTAWRTDQRPTSDLMLPAPVWVFSIDHGQTPMSPNAMTNRFDHLRAKVGALDVRLQDLRHYVATSMLQDGEAPLDVASQIGHASTATTLNVYAHFVPGRNRAAIDRLAGRLD